MSAVAHELPAAAINKLPPQAVNAKLIALIASGAVFFGLLLSGFVIDEPAPYDLYMVGIIAVWGGFGLRISRAVVPLLVLLIVMNIGGMISMTQMANLANTPLYLAVSMFLAFTAIFFAAVTSVQPRLYRLIFIAYVVSAVLTALLGIAGYFHAFPGAEVFTKYDRAAGAFQDPNVFGPFLVLPGVYLLYLLLTGPVARMPLVAAPLLIITAGIFFSFSRGAWGMFAVSAVLLTGALFLQSNSGKFRLRVVIMTIAAIALLVIAMVVILQLPGVAEMFSSRAHLEQSYDTARLGRFARYTIGFQMALEHPFGIGPLVFGTIFGEDTHDIWLKMLMDYGWLGFICFLTLTVWTIVAGFRILLRDRPWQPYLLCAYVAFVGNIGLGTFIDIDHWRHVYLLLGLIWGAIALEYRHQKELRLAPA
ncbi:O-antigen ligase domain-containing protein [Mesorhizobium sp. M4A.F.Ca.ET.020.02.1.1]|uniref:O-antigen ligase family protein n=1 Tax=unclassified Mesorhizobium TaxID=325217 RepID=UPI000FCBC707|nr:MULTISPECIES: O-antigen ligase family protein [unclassified Mesorhizobium]RUX45132.1 O-antigen ligase domain-containing protein [Mesorhizobium sp. M4A.F.Ca.ET.050.02.1.1]RVD40217.1 O-antigen ligase domain-containing protein [Mesorhizobium sp. M4A.F.Ca.ET.020.02.1.1]RWC21681.1 MAG: O-antigen ligase domain-containing protein [Mesorhizobium sp.]RWD28593.1 MAG: O-antigen ligase domain-containing protein [Mesorhizobium sp.]RWD35056.1 MAG: O-antigen ligase domain-containing protein [Mesorhizobium